MGAFGIWKLLILLGIVFVVFGGKKLKNLGSDLGHAIQGFKKAMDEGKTPEDGAPPAEGQNAALKSGSSKDAD
ncbi:MAG: Sec-independent protein translocase subunit TatA [Pseudomonadales bacterium]|jgi:sec-independent protein translocase protein TatA|nr:Sec-independent protein translocase subunit TatA [Pseudomonadales bacterium]